MTTTPNALSDAIKADYDELSASLPASAQFDRWAAIFRVSGLLGMSLGVGVILSSLLSAVAGPVGGMILVGLAVLTPVMALPVLTVFYYARYRATQSDRAEREAMFTRYAISVDTSSRPHIYSVGVPASWLKPELIHTRKALRDAPVPVAPDDVKPEPAAADEPVTKPGKKSPKDD